MSHSYIQAFGVGAEAEKEAFVTFIKHRRQRKRNFRRELMGNKIFF